MVTLKVVICAFASGDMEYMALTGKGEVGPVNLIFMDPCIVV